MAFLLTALLVVGMSVPAFAESGPAEPGTDPDTFLSGEEGDAGEGTEGDNGTKDDPEGTQDPDAVEEDPPEEDPALATGLEEEDPVEEGFAFPGMPEGFALSSKDLERKAELNEKGVVKSIDEMIAGVEYVEGEVALLSDNREYAEMVAEAYGGELTSYLSGIAVASLPEEATVSDAIKAAADPDSGLPAVYPNIIYTLPKPVVGTVRAVGAGMSAFSDPVPKKPVWSGNYSDEFLQDPNSGYASYQWFHDAVDTYGAWDTTMGTGIKVAVLDTGAESTHEDLSGNMLPGHNGFDGTNNAADDHGGATPSSTTENSHGTHVSGIIAAMANNRGGRGVAPAANIVPVKVLDSSGSGTTVSITNGLQWVANVSLDSNFRVTVNGDKQADVINMSLGGFNYYVGLNADLLYSTAVKAAIDRGIVVVAAAGNDGNNNILYPSAYPGVICVASTDMNGMRSSFSNYGPQITIAAPGANIMSTVRTGFGNYGTYGNAKAYDLKDGTSMASPMVAGAAALYLSTLSPSSRPTNAAGVTAVKNALVKQATKANSPSIGKIVNVGNMVGAITTVPAFAFYDSSSNLVTGLDLKAPVPNDLTLCINGSNYIVYTTNNKNPAIKNGAVSSGTGVAGNQVEFSLKDDFAVGKVVIKAASVNKHGVMSKISTLTITTISADQVTLDGGTVLGTSQPGMSPISGPAFLAASKTGAYTAKVMATAPAGTNKTVVWRIDNGGTLVTSSALASINATNGKLTIKPGATGTVTIRASARGPSANTVSATVYSTFNVTIQPLISKLTVTQPGGAAPLYVGGPLPGLNGSCILGLTATYADGTPAADLTDTLGYVTWKTSNRNVATVDPNGNVTAKGKGNATITATATDGSKKSAKIVIRCILPATKVTISKNTQLIAQGTSLTLGAATTPAKPSTAGVTWSVTSDSMAAQPTITAKGKLSIPAGVPVGTTVTVTATAKGGFTSPPGGINAVVTIKVVAKRVSKVAIGTPESYGRTAKKGKTVVQRSANTVNTPGNTNVTAVQLFTVNPPAPTDFDRYNTTYGPTTWDGDERKITLTGLAYYGSTPDMGATAFVWSSNRPAVAAFDDPVGKPGVLTMKGVGTATITCLFSDGSGRKATCTVTVGNPASSLWVQSSRMPAMEDDCPTLAYGKSLQMRALSNSAYGKVSNTKVAWSITPRLASDAKYYKITSAGKLSVSSSLRNVVGKYSATYADVTATALDGSGVSATQRVYICPGTEKMQMMSQLNNKNRLPYGYNGAFYFYNGLWSSNGGRTFQYYGNFFDDYIVTSSNPKVVGVLYTAVNSQNNGYVYLTGLKRGTSTIKIVSNDGTGKSVSFKVTVY